MLQGGTTMSLISRFKWLTRTLVAVTFALLFALATTISAFASVSLLQLSSDTFTNPDSQHATEVEPDTFAFGSTIVSAFQVGRIFSGGGADIGFATSTDGGTTWTSGLLPGITTFQGGGTSTAASDAAVAFDAAHNVWFIALLALGTPFQVVASRSSDGLTWQNP